MMNKTDQPGRNKTALITGASSGIGLELARLFARDGYNLVLVARSEQKLNQLADELSKRFGVSVKVIAKDLSAPSSPEELYTETQREGIHVDVLVNNAGFAMHGPFAEADLTELLGMLQVNIITLTHLTRLFLPGMIERHDGKILNLASTAAFQPGPLMAAYYASKSYVLSFSEAISNELEGTGVTVTALCPGPTETGFQERAAIEDIRMVRGQYFLMDAKTVARTGYRALMKGQAAVIPGLMNQLFAHGTRLVPRGFAASLARRFTERVK